MGTRKATNAPPNRPSPCNIEALAIAPRYWAEELRPNRHVSPLVPLNPKTNRRSVRPDLAATSPGPDRTISTRTSTMRASEVAAASQVAVEQLISMPAVCQLVSVSKGTIY